MNECTILLSPHTTMHTAYIHVHVQWIPLADQLRREGGRESVRGRKGGGRVPEGEREGGRSGGREKREGGREEGGCLGYTCI